MAARPAIDYSAAMTPDHAVSIDDLRLMAQRRVPRFAFDFLDGGAGDESNLRRNSDAFAAVRLTPRYLVDVSSVATATEIFGRSYAAPFAVAPIGMLNVVWPGADLALARLAGQRGIPYVASTAASTPLEALAEAADGNGWFQLYVAADDNMNGEVLRRAAAAGYEVMMVTVDVPVAARRERDIRNGFQVPFRMTPRIAADLARHPGWTWASLRAGRPGLANFTAYADGAGGSRSLAELQRSLMRASFSWDDLRRIRNAWGGRLLVKGILDAGDAARCVAEGCDGIVVSNHGGRQADCAPASIEALPAIVEAVAGAAPVILDSGIRRGADIVRARALGAAFCLLGRAFGYGVGAAGAQGAERAYDIIHDELTWTLGQLGQPDFTAVDGSIVA